MSKGTVFTDRGALTVQLPAESQFPKGVTQVEVRLVGKDRVLSPVGARWDSFFLNGPKVS